LGKDARVLKPEVFREEILEEIKKMSGQYK
jgi:hypothetical protein